MISREQLQSIEWAIKDEDGGSWCPACASPADIGHKCDCWLARALAAPPADAGAPPALVAIEQHARMMQDVGGTWHRAIPWEFVERAAWSPAPAPVAPPAETPVPEDGCTVQFEDMKPWPAPPAVAGGDAPEEGPRCTCPVRPCGACDYDPPRQLRSVSDGPYLKGQAPRRRRQEGQ